MIRNLAWSCLAILAVMLCLYPVAICSAADAAPAAVMDAGPAAAHVAKASFADPEKNPVGYASQVLEAVQHSNWRLLAVLLVVGLVWACRRYGGKVWPWVLTPRGGSCLALLWGIVGALANLILAGKGLDLQTVLNGVINGAIAAGGWNVAREIFGVSSKQAAIDADALLEPS